LCSACTLVYCMYCLCNEQNIHSIERHFLQQLDTPCIARLTCTVCTVCNIRVWSYT
jgi:hypothetical protein